VDSSPKASVVFDVQGMLNISLKTINTGTYSFDVEITIKIFSLVLL